MGVASERVKRGAGGLLAGLVKSLGLPAMVLDSEGGIIAASPEARKLLGLPAVATGLTLNSILSPRNPEWLPRQIRKDASKGSWAGYVVATKPGGELWVRLRACPAPPSYSDTRDLLLVLEDVTEQIEMTNVLMSRAEDLHNRNWELELVTRVSKLLLSNSDLQFRLSAVLREAAQVANADSGAIGLWDNVRNELVCRAVCGRIPESFIGNVSLPIDAESFTTRSLRDKETRITTDICNERDYVRSIADALGMKATLCVPLVVGSEAFGIIVVSDTSRRRSFLPEEVALVEIIARNTALAIHCSLLRSDVEMSRSYWQRTFDAIADIVFLVDADGRFLRANAVLASRLNSCPADLEGARCSDHLVDTDPVVWRRAVLARHPCSLGEMTIGGETCEVESYPLTGGGGEPEAAVIYARIVTGERRLREEVRQACRLAAVGELLQGTAHSFGQVLKSMEGTLKGTGEIGLAGDQVRQQIKAGSEIVQRLLRFAQGCEEKPSRVSLRQVTQAAIALCSRHPAADRKTIRNLVSPGLPAVEAQKWTLQEAVFSLILNGLEATAPGGCVTLTARTLERQASVELRVIDTGCGMDADERESAFAPFHSTKGGTGLGLSTSVAAVHRMGGVISLDTNPGQGTAVSIRLSIAGARRRTRPKRAA